MNPFTELATFYKNGGPTMHFILVDAVVIAAIVAERMIVIGSAATLNGPKMTDDLVKRIGRGDLAGAQKISMSSNAPAAKVAQAMLHSGSLEESKLQSAGDDAAALAMPSLTRRLSHLNTLANVSTLLGLLGTIFGLTTAFSAVGAADPAQRSAFLAAGISEALSATAFGLMVAVPTLLLHGFLAGLVERVSDQVDDVSIRLCRALSHSGGVAAPAHMAQQAPAAHPGQAQVLPIHGYGNAAPSYTPSMMSRQPGETGR
ncbi:MAG: MotA/TolQ/ExbB proton channel family protein [Candidatus Eiseniibacteriota bacterium]